MKAKKNLTADEFYTYCAEHDACQEGLKEIRGLDAATWFARTQHGSYIEWLIAKGLICVTPSQQAKYKRVKASALTEYNRVTAPALAEYSHVTASALTEYERVKASAWAEYDRVVASAWRKILGNPFDA